MQEGTLAALLERRAVAANLSAEPAVRFVQSEEMFEDPFRNAESRASEDMLRAIVAATDHSAPMRPQVRRPPARAPACSERTRRTMARPHRLCRCKAYVSWPGCSAFQPWRNGEAQSASPW